MKQVSLYCIKNGYILEKYNVLPISMHNFNMSVNETKKTLGTIVIYANNISFKIFTSARIRKVKINSFEEFKEYVDNPWKGL